MSLSLPLSTDHGHGVRCALPVFSLEAAHILVLIGASSRACHQHVVLVRHLALEVLLRLVGHGVAGLVGLPCILDVL